MLKPSTDAAGRSVPVDRPPSEVFIAIFRLLPPAELAAVMRVCRRWHVLAAPILWSVPKLFVSREGEAQTARAGSAPATPDNEGRSDVRASSSLPAASAAGTDHMEVEPESKRLYGLFKRRASTAPSSSACHDPQEEAWLQFVSAVCGPDWQKRPGFGQQLFSRCSALLLKSFVPLGGSSYGSQQGASSPEERSPRRSTSSEENGHVAAYRPRGPSNAASVSPSPPSLYSSKCTPDSMDGTPFSPVTSSSWEADTAMVGAAQQQSPHSMTTLDQTRTPLSAAIRPPPPHLGQYGVLIENLNLSGARLRVSDHAVRALAERCPNLRTINLSRCLRITDEAVTALAQRCTLESVNLTDCLQLTEASIYALATHCSRLKSLCVSGCPMAITDASAVALARGCGQRLAFVRIGGNFQLTDTGIIAIARGCNKRLSWLDVGRCPLVSDASVLALADHCPHLEWLDIAKGHPAQHQQFARQFQQQQQSAASARSTGIDATSAAAGANASANRRSAQALSPSASSQATTEIHKAACTISHMATRFFNSMDSSLPCITDLGVSRLVEACPKLQLLNLNGRSELTDAMLHAVSMHCFHLRSLTISGCTKVTTDAVKQLGSDRIGWVGMSPCPNVSFSEVCAASNWKVINQRDVPEFHLRLMGGQSWDDVGTGRYR
ncbi:hypothetical protein THASP1DRAFT_27460 [Thamnocephalis sphaerospora]|uniref:F-box domain-containing protein n=1 Tax=Thamnocephalis sphaerospora TaxID=78915 RepID=A0A4P9XYG9_9FUNG|nr:hypothetical protein THASP1DRAFT_27460 [Thamnocephalis sphaerospora]|eukprot:RKP10751.1 hypothetical protein THASP1DRAFT_27460 [Thamnocephalis sphaerospora]